MTDEYIKREDAIEAFDPRQRRDWYTPWIVETLKDLPSADVAPVVRCRDCKWRNTIGCDSYVASLDRHCCEDDDFCKWGERRDDE